MRDVVVSRAVRRFARRTALAGALACLAATAPAAGASDLFTPRDAGSPFSSPATRELTRAAAAAAPPAGFTDTTVWSNLVTPTTLRWAPDGRVFVASKSGVISVFDNTSDTTPTVYADLRGNVLDFLDRGLLGLAVDPQFSQGRPYLYVLYTYDKDPNSSQVPRWNDNCPDPPGADGNGCLASGRLSRIGPDGAETNLITDWCNQYSSHTVGALDFGPDGALYASSGEGASFTFADYGQGGSPVNPCGDPPGGVGSALTPPTAEGGALRSQSFRRPAGEPVPLTGSMIRVNPDTGAALPDNPAAGDANANRRRIVAHGMRNPFRFTFRPGTSEIWFGDVGWNVWEEIDRIPSMTTVRNYGWPCYEGSGRMAAYDSLNLNLCETLYGQNTATAPTLAYSHASAVPGTGCAGGTSSISGVAFYTGTQFPSQYRNALFMADYARRCLMVMLAGSDGLPDPSTFRVFESAAAGPVDLRMGPDGALYYADLEGGRIQKVSFPSGNAAPTARATATPDRGPTPLNVTFDATGSTDPDGDPLTYSWDLDGNGTFGDSTVARPAFTYTTPGPYSVRIRVTDPGGGTDTATVPVTAGSPPAVTIASPAASVTWAVGDPIAYSGSAADGQGNPLPNSALSWQLNILHCAATDPTNCHTHFGTIVNGVASGTFIAPNHDYPSRLDIVLTAKDANGLSASKTVTLDPKTVDLTLATQPAGGELTAGAITRTTPFTERFIQNATTDITAPSPQTIGGVPYGFSSWSDGGAITHTITVARMDTTYTATLSRVTESALAGADVIGSSVSQATPGRAEVYKTVGAATGSASKLRIYLDGSSTANRLALGLYADSAGRPGALLGQASTTTTTPGAWNEVTLPAPISITQGASYWIGLLNPAAATGTLRWRDRAGGTGGAEQTSASSTLAQLPSPWATGGSFTDGPVSAYVVGSIGGPAGPALSVTPSTLAFSGTAGGASPAAKTLAVANSGGGSLAFTVSDDAPWLSVSPASGSAPATVTVTADTAGLAAGTYSGTVTVGATGVSGSPQTIAVTLTVTAPTPPALSVTPTSLAFSATAGGPAPAAKTLAVSNAGTGSLAFTVSDDAPWMSVSPASGSAPADVTVSASPAGLAAGTYTGAVTVTASGASGSPQVIPVTLTVAPPGGELLAGANVIGTSTSSAPAGAGEAYRTSATTTGSATKLRLYVDGASTANRLTLGLYGDSSGTPSSLLGSGTTTTVTPGAWNEVTLASPISLTAGNAYWFALLNPAGGAGTLRWRDRAGGTGGAEQTSAARDLSALPLTWATGSTFSDGPVSGTAFGTAAPPPSPVLALSPASLSFTGVAGGSNPAARTATVSNTGGGTLNFTAADDAGWLSVTPASGAAPRDLTVSVDTAGLAAGTYSGTVTVTAAGAAGSPKTIPVTLTVTAPAPAALAVSPTSLSFSAAPGGPAPPGQALSVTNTGSGSLSFTATDDAPWITESPTTGAAGATVTVTVDPAGLAAGTHTGAVTIDAGAAGTRTVAVTLTLAAAPTGLVGAWGFDETGGATVTDASGRGNTGTLNGPARAASGKIGGALAFDGVNDWVTVPDAPSLRLTTSMTIEGWVNPTANGAGGSAWRTLAVKETASGLAYALYAFGDGGFPSGHAFTATEQWARGTAILPLNAWSHVATTYDGTTIRMYVNGVQVGTRAQTGSIVGSTGPLRFGGNALWPEWFAGRLDEIRVYNRPLPGTEIQADMGRAVSSPATLGRRAGLRSARAKRRPARRARGARNPGVQEIRFRARRPHGVPGGRRVARAR